MKLTKYGHACVMIENDAGERLIIDPGVFTELPADLKNIEAIVCTHVHADHTDLGNIQKIMTVNPTVKVYLASESAELLADLNYNKIVVDQNVIYQEIGIDLEFYITDHAVIWQNSPCVNLALRVGNYYYYPGDSHHIIDDNVRITGVPMSAPWLKLSESLEFAQTMNTEVLLSTHNGLLNEAGLKITHVWFERIFTNNDKKLLYLKNGESLV